MTWRSVEGVDIGGSSSQPSGSGSNHGLRRSMTMREAEIPARGIDLHVSNKTEINQKYVLN